MAFTYVASAISTATADGRRHLVRFLIGDTADTADRPAIFQDEELTPLLVLKGDNAYEAAATAFEIWARTAAKLAKRMERDGLMTERHAITELLACAASIRSDGERGTGTLQTGNIVSSNHEYLKEYRPTWTEFDDAPVVE